MMNALREFRRIARRLNADLNIVPLLYGSLGLQLLVSENLYPDDIDILVPQEYLDSKWKRLMSSMQNIGYRLVELHEHEFKNDPYKVAFSFIEDLQTYAQIEISEIQTREEDGVSYKLLSLHQYLKVDEKSSSDSYRADKNNHKHGSKLEIIKKNWRQPIMDTPHSTVEIIARVERAMERLTDTIQPLSPAQKLEPRLSEGRSVKDIMAHLTWWDQWLLVTLPADPNNPIQHSQLPLADQIPATEHWPTR